MIKLNPEQIRGLRVLATGIMSSVDQDVADELIDFGLCEPAPEPNNWCTNATEKGHKWLAEAGIE